LAEAHGKPEREREREAAMNSLQNPLSQEEVNYQTLHTCCALMPLFLEL